VTKRTAPNGREVVELGPIEKAMAGIVTLVVVGLLTWIGTTVQDLTVRVAKLEVRADMSDQRASGQ
jgi:hypothetical protein